MNNNSKNIDRYLKIFNALKIRGLNFVDIARALNITAGAITHFSYGYETSKRFDKWVKENLDLEL